MNSFLTTMVDALERIGLDALRFSLSSFLICLVGLVIVQILRNTSSSARFRYHSLMALVVALLMSQVVVHTKTSFFEFPLVPDSRVVTAEQVGAHHGSEGITTDWQASSKRSGLTRLVFLSTALVWFFGLLCLVVITWCQLWRGLRIVPGEMDVIATRQVRRRLKRLLPPEYRQLVHRILVLKSQSVPSLVGWRGRLIGFPVSANNWEDDLLPLVAIHELEHLRSGDYVKSLLVAILLCVQWMNPLSWLLSRLTYLEREIACDERAVSGLKVDTIEYFERLIRVAKKTDRMSPVPSIGGQNTLLVRVERLVQPKSSNTLSQNFRFVFALPFIAAVMAIPFTTLIAPHQEYDVKVTFFADAQKQILLEPQTNPQSLFGNRCATKQTAKTNRAALAAGFPHDDGGKDSVTIRDSVSCRGSSNGAIE